MVYNQHLQYSRKTTWSLHSFKNRIKKFGFGKMDYNQGFLRNSKIYRKKKDLSYTSCNQQNISLIEIFMKTIYLSFVVQIMLFFVHKVLSCIQKRTLFRIVVPYF